MNVQGQEPIKTAGENIATGLNPTTGPNPKTGQNRRPPSTSSSRVSKPTGPNPLMLVTGIVVVSVVVAVMGIIWKTREVIEKDRSAFLADSTAKQVSPLRRVIQQRLAQDRARLAQFATARSSLGPGRARAFGDFAMVAMLQPGSGGTWTPLWIEKGPLYSQFQGQIADQQELALLKSLPAGKIREGETHWQRFSDTKGLPIWAVAIGVETQVVSSGAGVSEALPEGIDYATRQPIDPAKADAASESSAKAIVVGIFGRNPLLTATEDFVGSTSTAWVVDDKGYAATHSNKAQVGALLSKDVMVKKIVEEQLASGATRYVSSEGQPLFGAFEKVDRSNLFVVMTTDEGAVLSSGASFAKSAATTGGLAVLVGVLLVMAWSRQLQRPVPVLDSRSAGGIRGPQTSRLDLSTGRDLNQGTASGFHRSSVIPQTSSSPVTTGAATSSELRNESVSMEELPEPVDEGDELDFGGTRGTYGLTDATDSDLRSHLAKIKSDSDGRVIRERAAAIASFAKGMEVTVREPMLAALAHVQLAVEKIQSSSSPEEVAEHVQSIEKDLRRAKDAIDEIESLSKERFVPGDDAMADVAQILRQVSDQSMAWAETEGIQIQLQTTRVPILRAEPGALRRAFEEVLLNARRSLRGRSIKQIQLSLTDTEDAVYVQVTDTGVGMDRERAAQAFEPFFTGFSDAEPGARGLGLARVKSIMEGHGGRVEISSRPGEGTTVTLKLPVSPNERIAFRTTQNQSLASSVASAFATPKVKSPSVSTGGSPPAPTPPFSQTVRESLAQEDTSTNRPFSVEDLDAGLISSGSRARNEVGAKVDVRLGGRTPLSVEEAAALPEPPSPDHVRELSMSMTASDIKRLEIAEAEIRAGRSFASSEAEVPAVSSRDSAKSTAVDIEVRPVASGRIKIPPPGSGSGEDSNADRPRKS